jgi:hypothetical protein
MSARNKVGRPKKRKDFEDFNEPDQNFAPKMSKITDDALTAIMKRFDEQDKRSEERFDQLSSKTETGFRELREKVTKVEEKVQHDSGRIDNLIKEIDLLKSGKVPLQEDDFSRARRSLIIGPIVMSDFDRDRSLAVRRFMERELKIRTDSIKTLEIELIREVSQPRIEDPSLMYVMIRLSSVDERDFIATHAVNLDDKKKKVQLVVPHSLRKQYRLAEQKAFSLRKKNFRTSVRFDDAEQSFQVLAINKETNERKFIKMFQIEEEESFHDANSTLSYSTATGQDATKCEVPFIVTNARSLIPKQSDFLSTLESSSPCAMIVTETWLTNDVDPIKDDNLQILAKYKTVHNFRSNKRGGGVSMWIDKNTISVNKVKSFKSMEAVLAVGKSKSSNVDLILVGIYLSPSLGPVEVNEQLEEVSTHILLNTKNQRETVVVIGGDWNNFDITILTETCHLTEARHGPTHVSGSKLDFFLISVGYEIETIIMPPLQPDDPSCSAPSDHNVVLSKIELLKNTRFRAIEYYVRPLTVEQHMAFSESLAETELYECVEDDDVELAALKLDTYLWERFNKAFPRVLVRRPNADKPWRDERQVNLLKALAREGKSNGRSQRWKNLRESINAREKRLINNHAESKFRKLLTIDPRTYWKRIEMILDLRNEDFDLANLHENAKNAKEVANEAAGFFAAISGGHKPIMKRFTGCLFPVPIISPESVEKSLNKMKNRNTSIEGDVPVTIIKENSSKLAGPLAILYQRIFESGIFPSHWKCETSIVIPKRDNPSSLSDTRNISLTKTLSKLAERLLLNYLEVQVIPNLQKSQFGGIEGAGIAHLISCLFDDVATAIDDGGACLLTAIDFSKAFNKVNHTRLITNLIDLGVDAWILKLLESYLENRTMCVRYRDTLSDAYHMTGGTPQGSLTGVILFIAYLDELSKIKLMYPELEMLQFIDDSYIYQNFKRDEILINENNDREIDASLMNLAIKEIVDSAEDKEMKINGDKTEIMIFRPVRALANYKSNVTVEGHTFSEPKSCLKILGCLVDEKLNPSSHISKNLKSARLRLMMLKKLKSRGLPEADLITVYKTMVRSVLEYGLNFYSVMLSKSMIGSIERFQRCALRIIFDSSESYHSLLQIAGLDSMEARMMKLFVKFSESTKNCRSLSSRLVSREEEGRPLRKNPGLKMPLLKTLTAQTTPLNVIRSSNVQTTPGRVKTKSCFNLTNLSE